MDANRDYGDEDRHADDDTKHIAPYRYGNPIYACTSDQYTHANFYEHGDGCAERDADPDDARHRPSTDGA